MVSFYANNISGAKNILIRQNHERSSCHYHLDDKIIFSKIGQKENLSPIEKIFNIFFLAAKISRVISRQRYDYIYSNGIELNIASLIAKIITKSHTRVICCDHTAFKAANSYYNFIRKILYRYAYKVIILTKDAQPLYENINANCSMIPHPTEMQKNSPYDKKSKIVISVGRLDPLKQFDHLVSAWKMSNIGKIGWQLKIFGTGGEKSKLLSLIDKDPSISLAGSSNYLALEYEKAAFAVSTSCREGMGVWLVEAQTFGLPIISYDFESGAREIINHDAGILVELNNQEQLAKNIQKLAKNEKMRINFSNKATLYATRYTPDKTLLSISKLFSL